MRRDSVDTLVTRWRNGHEGAANALYDRFRDDLFRLAYGMLGNSADAEEVMQDTLLYALSKIDRFDPNRASFRTWLHRICVSRVRDRQRRKRFAWLSFSESGRELRDSKPQPETATARSVEKDRIWNELSSLTNKQREVVLLRFWAGHTFREISEITGVSIPSVQSRLTAAYGRLREALGTDVADFHLEIER